MEFTDSLTEELKIYLEQADPVLMNDVLIFALSKLHAQLNDKEIEEVANCHKLLSAFCKQKFAV